MHGSFKSIFHIRVFSEPFMPFGIKNFRKRTLLCIGIEKGKINKNNIKIFS